jgi:O-antigen ligase
MFAFAVLLTSLYLVLISLLRSPFFGPRMGGLIVMILVVIATIYLARVMAIWMEWWGVVGPSVPPLRPAYEGLMFGNPNELAAMVCMSMAGAWAVVGTDTRRRRLATALLVGLGVAVLVISGSRGAWLGFAIGVAAATVVIVSRRAGGRVVGAGTIAASRRWRAGVLVAGLAITVLLAPSVLSRLSNAGGETLRLDLATTSLRMFQQFPATGSGPGTWASRRALATPPDTADVYVPHAHNLYAQALAEFGLLAVVGGIGLMIAVFRLVGRAARSADPIRVRFAASAAFAIGFCAGQQAVDFAANIPAVLFVLAFPIAWLDGNRTVDLGVPGKPRARGSYVLPALWTFLILGAAGFLFSIERGALTSETAVREADSGQWQTAFEMASEAMADDSELPVYSFNLGVAASRVEKLDVAAEAFSMSAKVDDFPLAWLDLAAIDYREGRLADVEEHLAMAMRLGYQQSIVAVPVGSIFLQMHQGVRATNAFADALRATPSLAGDPYWSSTEALRAARPQILAQAINSSNPWTGFEIAFFSGETELIDAAIPHLDSSSGSLARRVVDALSNQSLFEEFARNAIRTPTDLRSLGWCARLSALRGSITNRITCLGLLEMVDPGQRHALGDIARIRIQNSTNEDWAAGGTYRYYGLYLYQRAIPVDWLVPGLPNVDLVGIP